MTKTLVSVTITRIISKNITFEVEDDKTSPETLINLFDRCLKSCFSRFKSNNAMITITQNIEYMLEKAIQQILHYRYI